MELPNQIPMTNHRFQTYQQGDLSTLKTDDLTDKEIGKDGLIRRRFFAGF
jgi:hypothetical protein